jgi:sugar phosphate isomerase/epimerase
MARKYSLSHLTVLGWTTPEMIYNAKLIGYDYVSIRNIYMGLKGEINYDLSGKNRLYKLTKKALADTEMKIHDIELAMIRDDRDVSSYEPAIEVAAELGATDVISSIWSPNKGYYIEQFAKLCDIAAQYKLYVNLEFVTWANVYDLKNAKEVVNTVNKSNAAFLIDTLHFYRSNVELSELDEIPESYLRIVHICDGPKEKPLNKEKLIYTGRDARLYVGEGAIDISAIIKRLPKDIILSIELPHNQRVQDYGYTEHARRCLEIAKKYFANLTE